eukprot:CAMPEP_0170413226 /NCGR_PEP_ID=MMETSP0117_2-20130122/31409_1 /TAXON_ID=400756 /ORGANISM="Durinskia baltica, Strain CSIRO CS-38" /LENGTH=50 /DNA_ID=CAMNT_0010671009 /DNA_START=68 /DNA_END=217 /DNA_ORIENTATION=-
MPVAPHHRQLPSGLGDRSCTSARVTSGTAFRKATHAGNDPQSASREGSSL